MWIIVIIIFIIYLIINHFFTHVIKSGNKHQDVSTKKQTHPKKYQTVTITDSQLYRGHYLQKLGIAYEKKIGEKFEELGYYVVYNGLIKGFANEGVDLIAIGVKHQEIHFIQCKNWKKMVMTNEVLEKVYQKLSSFHFHPADYAVYDLASYQQIINTEHNQLDITQIEPTAYKVRKSLYISYDRSIHVENGQYLTMMGAGIFKYKDMKIVTTNVVEDF